MDFQALQDRCMGRLRLSTAVARARIKNRINERVRAVQSGVGLAKTRVGTLSINCTNGNAQMATTGIIKAFIVAIPLQNRVLDECSMVAMRLLDPSNAASGTPTTYAIEKMGALTSTLHFYPKPDAIYAIQVDGLLVGSDLSANSDVAGIPEDFHDIIIDGTMADEYGDMENQQAKVGECEGRYDKRLKELRYFIAKDSMSRRQGGEPGNPTWLVNLGHWI